MNNTKKPQSNKCVMVNHSMLFWALVNFEEQDCPNNNSLQNDG